MNIDKRKLEIALANVPMSYAELAKISGTAQVTLARMKKGKQEPRPETVGKIAKALGVKVTDIIKKEDDINE